MSRGYLTLTEDSCSNNKASEHLKATGNWFSSYRYKGTLLHAGFRLKNESKCSRSSMEFMLAYIFFGLKIKNVLPLNIS